MKRGYAIWLAIAAIAFTPLSFRAIAQAGTCAANCGPVGIRFTPGQRVQVELINHTNRRLRIEQVLRIHPRFIGPGETIQLNLDQGTAPNASVMFWDETASMLLRAVPSQPDADTLRIDLYRGGPTPGDRAVYILDDGRILLQ